MSDLFDEYPMLVFALEALVALGLLIFIVVWTSSGKKKSRRAPSGSNATDVSNDAAKRR